MKAASSRRTPDGGLVILEWWSGGGAVADAFDLADGCWPLGFADHFYAAGQGVEAVVVVGAGGRCIRRPGRRIPVSGRLELDAAGDDVGL